jgi:hypothetical protein
MDVEVLRKFFDAPGFCSKSEVIDVERFLNEYIEIRDLYKEASGVTPMGETLESNLKKAEWYTKEWYIKEL